MKRHEVIPFEDHGLGTPRHDIHNQYAQLFEIDTYKEFLSKNYNYVFNKKTGFHARWGKTKDDNPDYSPFGPEIADIEISTVCSGIDNKPCRFCYKSNTNTGQDMSFETFRQVFHNLPHTLTQIAFGIGNIDANPDLWRIFEYCRNNDHNEVIPNVTINGARLTPEILDKLASTCGAVAVSRYNPPDHCYNAIKELTDRGMKQVNIHMLLSSETYEDCWQVIRDAKEDPRLEGLNAIVFLALKPKGRGRSMTPLRDTEKYKKLIEFALENEVNFGFDSCSAPLFLTAVKDSPNYDRYLELAEPCESYLFSIYIDVNGITYPCSFMEDEVGGIDMTQPNMALKDYWLSKSTKNWRKELLDTAKSDTCLVKGCRQCPRYDIY
jgi:MoaA/NifB/PqqE/SkfB family radical SAM enzyme